MELLSILNPPITNPLNDPRLTSSDLLKIIDDQQKIITEQLKGLSVQVKKEDLTPIEVMIFACLQHHLHVTTLNTKLTARMNDLVFVTTQLNLNLERLTRRIIILTVALVLLALPPAIEVVLRWLR